jgi:hypothetical protein
MEGVEEAAPLTPAQIVEQVFSVAKRGPDSQQALEDLIALTSEDPELILECDEKGWTPLLWASFHGHWKVRTGEGACLRSRRGKWVSAPAGGAALAALWWGSVQGVAVRRSRRHG